MNFLLNFFIKHSQNCMQACICPCIATDLYNKKTVSIKQETENVRVTTLIHTHITEYALNTDTNLWSISITKGCISSCCNGQDPAMPTALQAVQHAAPRRVRVCLAAASHHPAALWMHYRSYYSSSLHFTPTNVTWNGICVKHFKCKKSHKSRDDMTCPFLCS